MSTRSENKFGSDRPSERTFDWTQTERVLLDCGPGLRADPIRQRFSVCDDEGRPMQHVLLPPALRLDASTTMEQFIERAAIARATASQREHQTLIVLMQAGAAGLGLWRGESLIAHKNFKRYVVRGNGKAQPTWLATRGKSRYGSRLRLQQARAMLDDVNERLHDWTAEHGAPQHRFFHAPIRLWHALFCVEPSPPLPRDSIWRLPRDCGVPSLQELELAFRSTRRGRIVTVEH